MHILVVVLLVLLCWSIALRRRRTLKVPLPPSPPSDPILGHLRYVPLENPELQYAEWAKVYGDVVYLRILNRPIIVLNSAEAATELLEKRGENYSDRPNIPIFHIMGWVNALAFMHYGKRFQKHRKLFQDYFSKKKVGGYTELQVAQARQLAISLAKGNEDREHILERFGSSIVLRIAYGHDMFRERDNTYNEIVRANAYNLTHCGPIGGTPVDLFPILRHFPSWFPGTFYAARALEFRPATEKTHDYPFAKVQQQMLEGTARPCFVYHHLENLKEDEYEGAYEDIKGAAGSIFTAGSETTWSTLSAFVLGMVVRLDCQEKARKELDDVLGRSRLPELEDRQSLPYVECILQETYRWLAVVPLGIPHRALNDDVYKNMFIPKGAVVFANIWAILRDEKVYHDPATFNPARYLPKSKGGNEEPFPGSQFGYGRRICPGRYLADSSIWIAIATILSLFRIERVKDKMGKDVVPPAAMETGFTSHPKPYEAVIRLRDTDAKALLEEAEVELRNDV